MSYERITRHIIAACCDKCGHQWEASSMPQRCAKCRLYSWNGADGRRGRFKQVRVQPSGDDHEPADKRRGKFTRVRVAQKAGKP